MAESYTESHYENAVLQLFRERLGYTNLYGPDIASDFPSSLQEAISDSRTGRNLYGPFDTAEEAVASMLED